MTKNCHIIVKKWLDLMKDDQFIQKIQEQHQQFLDSQFHSDNFEQVSDEEILKYVGDYDCENRKNGEAVVYYKDGTVFHGSFKNNQKSGRGMTKLPKEDEEIHGYYFNDKLIGNVIRINKTEGWRELYFCKQGIKHGFTRKINEKYRNVEQIGIWLNGKKHGYWWIRTTGGGYFLKQYENSVENKETTFLFPNYKTSFVGIFCDDILVKAQAKEVELFEEKTSILFPSLSKEISTNEYRLERNLQDKICDYPHIVDPYESSQVEVKLSNISNAGQGLFSNTRIAKGQIIAYFHGVKILKSEQISVGKELGEYAIDLDDYFLIDIPEKCRDESYYKATLGHKICHSFKNNASFSHAFHPRFGGLVRCAIALRNIEAGEEITCNYKYNWNKAPIWYKNDLFEHLLSLGMDQKSIKNSIESFEKYYSR